MHIYFYLMLWLVLSNDQSNMIQLFFSDLRWFFVQRISCTGMFSFEYLTGFLLSSPSTCTVMYVELVYISTVLYITVLQSKDYQN